jgi:hypothetical protein
MKTRKLTFTLISLPERQVEQMFFAGDISRAYHGKCNICVHPDGGKGRRPFCSHVDQGTSECEYARICFPSLSSSPLLPLAAARQGAQSLLRRCRTRATGVQQTAATPRVALQSYCLLWWKNLNSYKVNKNIARVQSGFL